MTIPRSIGARRVLVDSGAYFAVSDARVVEHQPPIRVRAELVAQGHQLSTTNFVLTETHALILSQCGGEYRRWHLAWVAESHTTYVRVKRAEELRKIEIISTHDDKD